MSWLWGLLVLALANSAAASSRSLLLSIGAGNGGGCIKAERYSCGVPAEVSCGEDVSCVYPQVCDYNELERCKEETFVEEECTGEDEFVCKLVQKPCGDDLFCAWNELCNECTGEDCEQQFSCSPLNDLPKKCTSKPHYKCKERLEHSSDPGYYGGYKYDWLPKEEWNRELKCGDKLCEDKHHCARAMAEECVVDPEYEDIAVGVECGENLCEPGHKCKSQRKCEDVEKKALKCATVKKHTCVDPAQTKHENYLFRKAPEGLTSCGPYWCVGETCDSASSTSCAGPGRASSSARVSGSGSVSSTSIATGR
ncbi:hypothetical protein BSKO_07848 [Bryopsis sp. KO-2023]|nr:hypothetical protein BSKO_07848 [Bryopsis sp. KO-2023]